MFPDKNQAGSTASDQNQQTANQQRPDWIIPDNGLSSRQNQIAGNQREQQTNDNHSEPIDLDNEETLGIP